MAGHESGRILKRRAFFSKLTVGLAAGGAVGAVGASAQAQSGDGSRWQAARHAQDDWLDQIPGKHRYVVDAPTPEGFGNALAFLNNYFNVNQNDYGLKDGDLAVVLIARHMSTLFAYNDAIWTKYGVPITQGGTNFNDPKTKQPPTINLFNSTAYGREFPVMTNRGVTIDSLLKRGLHLGVCQVSSRGYAGRMAMATGASADTVFAEMSANLVPNARFVPAGIVAVNRAQERGYSLAYC